MGISLGHGEFSTVLAFCLTLAIMALVGGSLWLLCRKVGKLVLILLSRSTWKDR